MVRKQMSEENLTKLVFQCSVCRRTFKDPGICNTCDVVLKAKAA